MGGRRDEMGEFFLECLPLCVLRAAFETYELKVPVGLCGTYLIAFLTGW